MTTPSERQIPDDSTSNPHCGSSCCLHRQSNGTLDVNPNGEVVEIFDNNALRSPLLKLPAELRGNIWEYVIGTHNICRPNPIPSQQAILPFDLLRTCRQIYIEAAPIVFTQTTLVLRPKPSGLNLKCHERFFSRTLIHIDVPQGSEPGESCVSDLPLEEIDSLAEVEVCLWYEYDSDIRRWGYEVDDKLKEHFRGKEVSLRHEALKTRTATDMMWEGIWDEVDDDDNPWGGMTF